MRMKRYPAHDDALRSGSARLSDSGRKYVVEAAERKTAEKLKSNGRRKIEQPCAARETCAFCLHAEHRSPCGRRGQPRVSAEIDSKRAFPSKGAALFVEIFV